MVASFSKLATRRNPCGVLLSCSSVRARSRCRQRARGPGRSTDRFCGLSRSIMRIPTRAVSTAASTSAPPAVPRCLAPTGGIVSFAGTVPTGGKTVSIETPLGYTATLVHLGTIGVKRGAPVGEGSVVGTVGPSGVPELSEPYVYFGLRTTSDQQGYVDPMVFLPSPTRAPPATAGDAPAVTAVVGSASTAEAPATEPVVAATTTVTASNVPAERVAGSPAASAPVAAPVSARVEPSAAGAVAEARPTSDARVAEEPGPSVMPGAAEVTLAGVPVQVSQRHGVKAAPRHRQRPSPAESRDSRPAAGSSHGLQHETEQASRPVAAMTQPAASKDGGHSWTFALGALVPIFALACAWRRRSAQKAARIIFLPETETHVHAGESQRRRKSWWPQPGPTRPGGDT